MNKSTRISTTAVGKYLQVLARRCAAPLLLTSLCEHNWSKADTR